MYKEGSSLYMLRGLLTASIISIGLAVVISMLPLFESDFLENGPMLFPAGKTVMQVNKPVHLEKEKLVSFLKQIPLHHSYRKVNMANGDLFIDLWSDADDDPQSIYEDAAQIIYESFMKTSNIDHVYLRFVADEGTDLVLLFAVMGERRIEEMKEMEKAFQEMNAKQFLSKYTQMIYGTGWQSGR